MCSGDDFLGAFSPAQPPATPPLLVLRRCGEKSGRDCEALCFPSRRRREEADDFFVSVVSGSGRSVGAARGGGAVAWFGFDMKQRRGRWCVGSFIQHTF